MRKTLVVVAGLGAIVIVAVVGIRLFREPGCPSGNAASPFPVLVAKQLIPKGTTGEVIVRRQLAEIAVVRCSERVRGVISDRTYLAGQVATSDLFPGQQLSDADFSSP